MLFKSQTSKKGRDVCACVCACVCVFMRESKHNMNVDYFIPSVFMLDFSLSHKSHLSLDVMFVIFSGEINIYVDGERVAPIPFVYLFFL